MEPMRKRTTTAAVCLLLGFAAAQAGERTTEPVGSPVVHGWQGHWQAFENGSESFTMNIDGFDFHATVDPQTWYSGKIFVRTGEIDFLIEDCSCNEKGKSADAIFEWVEDEINVWIASPGNPRPTFFELDDRVVRVFRRHDPDESDDEDESEG